MTLARDEVVAGFGAELTDFEELVRSLGDDEWRAPSRCEGWAVADVAAHTIGTLADVVAGRLDGLGSPEVTAREVEERRGRSQAELADELEQAGKVGFDLMSSFDEEAWNGPAPGGITGTLGAGVEALWYDLFLHADDIRVAAGRPSEPSRGRGLVASVSHVADGLEAKGWGPATLALDGMPEFEVGGGGRRITGDPMAFVLAATGRADPASLGLDPSVNIYG